MKVDLDVWGFAVPCDLPDGSVVGIWKGKELHAAFWRDGDRGGVVNVKPESYVMLRMAGVPELGGRDGRHPLWCALRDLGAATGGLGIYSRVPLEYVFVERDGPVFNDEATSWYQVGQRLCYLDWVWLPGEGEKPCRVEVRLPWALDLGRLEDAARSSGWAVEPYGGDYPALRLAGPFAGLVAGVFPDGQGYVLLPPDREAGGLGEAARRGYPAFEAVLPLLLAAEVPEPLAVDLFAGAGGLSLGLHMAGWRVAVAVEWDANAAATYRHNLPDAVVICDDIARVESWEILELCGGRKPDLVCGGPPCQGFSVAGDRDPNDPRNMLYREFVRVVRDLEPAFVLMENVPGLLSMKTPSGEPVLDVIRRDFRAAGYPNLYAKVLNAACYAVPQDRCRVIFLGRRGGGPVLYPVPATLPPRVIEELEERGLAGLFSPGGELPEGMNPDPEPDELVLVQSTQGTWVGRLVSKGEARWAVRDLRGKKREVPGAFVLGFGRHTVAAQAAEGGGLLAAACC